MIKCSVIQVLMLQKEVLVHLLEPANEFELKHLARSYEEENASETFNFLFDKESEFPAYENPFTLNTKNKPNQNFFAYTFRWRSMINSSSTLNRKCI